MEEEDLELEEEEQRRVRKWPFVLIGVLLAGVLLYLTFVYSSIPFIAKWRTLYIETAMSTMTHQWLATWFIPRSVVDKVVAQAEEDMSGNLVEGSGLPEGADASHRPGEGAPRASLTELFPELDPDTIPRTILSEDAGALQIRDIADKGIRTRAGDLVWAIDGPNGILICEVTGEGYAGKLAIVHDSARVILAANRDPDGGKTVTRLCEDYDAVLGINASGFYDPEGHGSGAQPGGLVRSEGETVFGPTDNKAYQIAGFDREDNFRVGYGLDIGELRDAMQFYPVLIVDGQAHITGSFGMGIQPRTVIGQTEDKAALMLVIDGRQVGHSLGTTVAECADILLRYDCWTAMNMDGGSSSSMTYLGEMITKTSSPAKSGRRLPDAWVVRAVTKENAP